MCRYMWLFYNKDTGKCSNKIIHPYLKKKKHYYSIAAAIFIIFFLLYYKFLFAEYLILYIINVRLKHHTYERIVYYR